MSAYPSLYQINTRVWLTSKSRRLGRPATLDDITDAELEAIAGLGFDWVWLLSVWQTGQAGRAVSCSRPDWEAGFRATLPDLHPNDIGGSGFAIRAYHVPDAMGGDNALARLRQRMHSHGLKLMVDFVPNHVALDHPWLDTHPEYFIEANAAELAQEPQNYVRLCPRNREHILAYGRDPCFPGWPDALQLNYANPDVQQAMRRELISIATRTDGARCDMAMLLLPEVFERTWKRRMDPFWPETIEAVKRQSESFLLLAEVYWDLEWELQRQGFDYTYDKRLLDRLRTGGAREVRVHLGASLDFQNHLARFLENHDEARAARTFGPDHHRAAAVVAYLAPGMRFFQQGQLQGHQHHVSPHLVRGPEEETDPILAAFYQSLLDALRRRLFREGKWSLLEARPAWEGNPTHDDFLLFRWECDETQALVCVNYAPHASQCYVPLAWATGLRYVLTDRLGTASYARGGEELSKRGLYLDMPAWGYHVFEIQAG